MPPSGGLGAAPPEGGTTVTHFDSQKSLAHEAWILHKQKPCSIASLPVSRLDSLLLLCYTCGRILRISVVSICWSAMQHLTILLQVLDQQIHAQRQMDGIQSAKARGVVFGRLKRLTRQQIAELQDRRRQGTRKRRSIAISVKPVLRQSKHPSKPANASLGR